MNSDLQREQSLATFDKKCITHLLDGSASRTARRRELEAIIRNDTLVIFSNESNIYLHHTLP